MNYTEKIERSERFKIAIKISFPFIILVLFLKFLLIKDNDISILDIVLFGLLIIFYVYFSSYMIYQNLKHSIIDATSMTFSREKTQQIIEKFMQKSDERESIVLLKFENLSDLSERLGIKKTDEILKDTIKQLDRFLIEQNYENSIIGHYNASCFLLYVFEPYKSLTHSLITFIKRMQSQNVQILLKFSAINANFDPKFDRTINHLLNAIKERETTERADMMKFEKSIIDSVDESAFLYKTQRAISLDIAQDDMTSVITAVKTHDLGVIARSKFMPIIAQNEYNIKFDKANFAKFCTILKERLKSEKFIFELSTNAIKDAGFLNFIKDFTQTQKIVTKNIVFEFSDDFDDDDLHWINQILKEYKNLGFSFAISHFGGLKSNCLNYLCYLDVEFVIFDMCVSKDLQNEKVMQIYSKIVEICSKMGVRTIAKFIQTQGEFEAVKEARIDYAHGFYIQKPTEIYREEA